MAISLLAVATIVRAHQLGHIYGKVFDTPTPQLLTAQRSQPTTRCGFRRQPQSWRHTNLGLTVYSRNRLFVLIYDPRKLCLMTESQS